MSGIGYDHWIPYIHRLTRHTMSGGRFDHKQWQILHIAEDIDQLVKDDFRRHDEEFCTGRPFVIDHIACDTPEQRQAIVDEAKCLVVDLRDIYERVRNLDYLLSGDDGPETFISRLKQ